MLCVEREESVTKRGEGGLEQSKWVSNTRRNYSYV